MAKKNSTFGKLLAFTTIAAIGGVCYVYRDRIKESSIYKKSKDAFSNLRNKVSDKFAEEEDFFFDDDFEDEFEDDVFSEDAKNNREYTSITINAKENASASVDETTQDDITASDDEDTENDEENAEINEVNAEINEVNAENEDNAENDEENAEDEEETTVVSDKPVDDMKEIFADTAIPTITFGAKSNTVAKDESSATAEGAEAYENEGLSDSDEDPDTLEAQDRLDF